MIATTAKPVRLLGVDFTSAPTKRKPITAAIGMLLAGRLQIESISRCPDFGAFEQLLRMPGPWLGAFDFPFGLPREGVEALEWPLEWGALASHCAGLGRAEFKRVLDHHREQRPRGQRYPHRQTDLPARSHSPFKLVNPPVGFMFLEGAPRLLSANVHIPGLHAGDPNRVALEAYPALLARRFCTSSYKSDDRRKQTQAREDRRELIVAGLEREFGLAFTDPSVRQLLIHDASGDSLDAALALTQAAIALTAPNGSYGLPRHIDPIEGWIASV